MASDHKVGEVNIKTLSKRTRVNISTLQHWARLELLDFSRAGRTRAFPATENVKRVHFIVKTSKNKKFTPLATIKEMIERGEHKK